MKRRVVLPALALFAAAGVAGCTTAPGGPAGPTTSPTQASTCPVGSWRSTSVAASPNVAGVSVSLQGGADVATTIGADGAVSTDFTAMKPVVYTATVAGSQVTGELTYQGSINGKVTLGGTSTATTTAATSASTSTSTATPTSTSTTSAGATAPWRPVGAVNFADLRLTVKLTKPVALAVINNAKISEVTTAQTAQVGNIVDLQPLLRNGDYRCDGNDTLIVTPSGSGGPTVVWTMTRVTGTTSTGTGTPTPTATR